MSTMAVARVRDKAQPWPGRIFYDGQWRKPSRIPAQRENVRERQRRCLARKRGDTTAEKDAPASTYIADGVSLATPPGTVQSASEPSTGEHFLLERFLLRGDDFRPGVDEVKTSECGRRELFGVADDMDFAMSDGRIFLAPVTRKLHPDHITWVEGWHGRKIIRVAGFDYAAELALWKAEQA